MRFQRAKGRLGSTPTGVMNRTEAKFAERLLSLKLAGEIVSFHYEAFKFCIVPGLPGKRQSTYYTPDFLVLRADLELELIDVKGGAGWEDTARVKIKAAAERFPEFHWVGYTLTKAGAWNDDSQVASLLVVRGDRTEGGAVLVIVEPLRDDDDHD